MKDLNLVFTFGKHKGYHVDDVPASYLLWCYDQDWFAEQNPIIFNYIVDELKAIKNEAKQDKMAAIAAIEEYEDWRWK